MSEPYKYYKNRDLLVTRSKVYPCVDVFNPSTNYIDWYEKYVRGD